MIEIKIKAPQALNDIPLHKWQSFYKIASEKGVDPEFLNRRTLSLFYDIRGDIYDKVAYSDVQSLLTELQTIMNTKPSLERFFTLDGVEYGLIPNFDDMTFGEFADLDKYHDFSNYHKLMSVLFREVTVKKKDGRYQIKPYEGSHDLFKEMPTGVALGVLSFFLTLGEQLTRDILKSSIEEYPEMTKRIMEKNGVGTFPLTSLPGGMFPDMSKLFDLMLTHVSRN